MSNESDWYGCMAIFDRPGALLEAVRDVTASGYRDIEVYSPYALEELDALLPRRHHVAWAAFIGGVLGGLGTFGLEYYAAVFNYPIRVGGRPFDSWPAFVPAGLEMTFLFAAAAGVLAMLIGNRLPQWYHPVFHIARFAHVSQDAFALVARARNDDDLDRLATVLRSTRAVQVEKVPL
jgi:hypothetical protein